MCSRRTATVSFPLPEEEVFYETETSFIDVPEDNYRPFVNIPDYSPISSQYYYNEFDLNYFTDNGNQGVNPQLAFQNAFENHSETGTTVNLDIDPPFPVASNAPNPVAMTNVQEQVTMETPDEQVWDIPQLNTEEKTGPKISSGFAKAVNAALTVKSNKDSLAEIGKKYLRPDNVTNLCAPKCNKEIWNVVKGNAHTKDLALQEVQKYFALGLTPINKKEGIWCINS